MTTIERMKADVAEYSRQYVRDRSAMLNTSPLSAEWCTVKTRYENAKTWLAEAVADLCVEESK